MKILFALAFSICLYAQPTQVDYISQVKNRPILSDAGATSLASVCTPGVSVSVTQIWVLQTQTLPCQLVFNGGQIIPNGGQTVILSGPLVAPPVQIFDTSTGGRVRITGTQSFFYPQWWGAKCDGGTTDDRDAIQAAIDAAGGGTLYFPSARCGIASSIHVSSTVNQGLTIISAGLSAQSGLIAIAGSPAFQMLSIFANSVTIKNLWIDCNHVATSGLVMSMANGLTGDNIHVLSCTSDGTQIDPYANPTTTSSSQITVGSSAGSTFTVTQAALAGVTLGSGNCSILMLEKGTVRQEFLLYNGSGNVMTQGSIVPAYTHPIGSTVRCNGNNNLVHLTRLANYGNGGWGLNIFAGSDQNAIVLDDASESGNTLGGELWSGSITHIHGLSEGNGGPAIQLGDLNGGSPVNGTNGRATFFVKIFPFDDLENSLSAYNAVTSVCSIAGTIIYRLPEEYIPNAAGPFCPGEPSGTTDSAFGYSQDFNGFGIFSIKSNSGTTNMTPDGTVIFNNLAGVETTRYNPSSSSTGAFAVQKDSPGITNPQFEISGIGANTTKKFFFGIDTTNLRSYMQCTDYGTSACRILFNPGGGRINLGDVNGCGTTFANNAAALAGSLSKGDVYCVTGTDPRQTAVVF